MTAAPRTIRREKATPMLTDSDRRIVERARVLSAVTGADAVCEHTGEADPRFAYAVAFSEAAFLLAELADRLEGDGQ